MTEARNDICYVVTRDKMYMSSLARRGKASHTWTNLLRKARKYSTLSAARNTVIEASLAYPYDENGRPSLENVWIREVLLVPQAVRHEIIVNYNAVDQNGDAYIEIDMVDLEDEDNECDDFGDVIRKKV